jgi:hypothetical protein
MKYENFDAAKSIVEKIKKQEEFLKDMRRSSLEVRIANGYGGVFMTIGAEANSEHNLAFHARSFTSDLISASENQIKHLKYELEKL